MGAPRPFPGLARPRRRRRPFGDLLLLAAAGFGVWVGLASPIADPRLAAAFALVAALPLISLIWRAAAAYRRSGRIAAQIDALAAAGLDPRDDSLTGALNGQVGIAGRAGGDTLYLMRNTELRTCPVTALKTDPEGRLWDTAAVPAVPVDLPVRWRGHRAVAPLLRMVPGAIPA